jgi:hypothetical protein
LGFDFGCAGSGMNALTRSPAANPGVNPIAKHHHSLKYIETPYLIQTDTVRAITGGLSQRCAFRAPRKKTSVRPASDVY